MVRAYAVVLAAMICLPGISAAVAAGGTAEGTPRRNLTVDDYFGLKQASDPQISPEGDWVAYVVSEANLKEDRWEKGIWAVPVFDGEALRMTAPGSSAARPRWSPDGKYLAFLSARNKKKTQVWILNRRGGDSQPLTDVRQGIESFEWSPDGKRLVLVIQDPTPEDVAAELAEQEGKTHEAPKHPPPHVVDRLQFKQDYVGYLDRRRTHLYVFDTASEELVQITGGDYDDAEPAWSPDGTRLAFVSNRTEEPDLNYNTDVWIVAADRIHAENPPRRLTPNEGPDESPSWSPDGEWITWVSTTDVAAMVYATPHLAVARADGSAARVLTAKVDRHVRSPRFSSDGESILFLLEDSGEQHLARISRGGGKIERPIAGPVSVDSFSPGPDGTVAALVSKPTLPHEVFLLEGRDLRRLTNTNGELLAQLNLSEAENVQFKSADGTEIEGFVYKPPGFEPGTRYPAILRIHGGPQSQYDFAFQFESQLYAANGYIVIMTNPRGSTGYGQDFCLAIFQDWGGKDYDDVMAGVDFVIEQGYADPERLGVGGWSYGGILTNYVIAKTNRFRGAISGASEVLIAANYGHDIYQRWWERELGLPWERRDLYEKLSVFNDVEKIETPTLILGGEVDWNVPVQNSEQLYLALKRLGRETELIVYPGEYHGLRIPSYQKDRYERYLAWFARFVKGESSPAR